MILAIDTSSTIIAIGLYWPGKIKKVKLWKSEKGSEKLLLKIDQFLTGNGVKFKDLKAIVTNRGPGSFTGLRVGIATANALGYALKIPVIGIILPNHQQPKNQKNIFQVMTQGYQKLQSGKISSDSKVLPNYN